MRIKIHGELGSGHSLVRFPVASCSGYLDRNHPSLREMEEAAWILRTSPPWTSSGS